MPRPRSPRAALTLTALVALVTLLAACSGGGSSSSAGPARAAVHPVHAAQPSRPLVPDAAWGPGKVDKSVLAGFADRVSVLPGERVRLFVSTSAPSYDVTALRMGWYGGAQAARIASWHSLPGRVQPPAAEIAATRTPYAPWRPSVTVTTAGWPAGDYLFRLSSPSGYGWLVPLTVRSGSTRGRVVLLNAVTTWQAYNAWGGRSLYLGLNRGLAGRAYAVSFDRPYDFGAGTADFLGNELPVVALAERLRLPLAYATDVDLHTDPHLLDGARALVSLGHDEYWSAQMRANATAARDHGTNIAFLGANAAYRPVRFAATALGPDRLEIDYKNAQLDPVHATDPEAATGWSWDSGSHPRPQSVLTGTFYECNPVQTDMVAVDPHNWLLSGVAGAGEHLRGLVGSEFDRVDPAEPTPRPIEVLFHSPVVCRGARTFADAAYYTTSSGAGVFDSGTSSFVCALQPGDCGPGRGDAVATSVVRAVVTRLLEAFAAGPAARRHPAHDNLAQVVPGAPALPAGGRR